MLTSMNEVMQVVHRFAPPQFTPKVGLILGSGLSSLAEQITNPVSIPYQAIPGLKASGVPGHPSQLVMGHLAEVPVICLRGRLHLYEGNDVYESMRILIQIIKQMGADMILITCAVGAILDVAMPGDVMMIVDHINFQPGNPLVTQHDESIGPRFLDMEEAYDVALQDIMEAQAEKLEIPLFQGVYVSTLGPSFETPAEIRVFQQWGADAVGMSLVPEVILARYCGLRVACLAAITNKAAGLSEEVLTHEGTLHFGEIASRKLTKLIPAFLKEACNAMA